MSDTMRATEPVATVVKRIKEGGITVTTAEIHAGINLMPGTLLCVHQEQNQPSPPVPQTVQEIMRLMSPYISACVDAGVNNVTGRMSLQFEADVAKIEATFQPLHAALTALVEKNHELQFSLDGVNAMREPLTDEQRKDLVAAAFYIAAKDDEHACLKCDDAERIVEVLCAIAEFEPPTSHGIEPQQGEKA